MFPILHLGPLALQSPGLILLAGLWLGLLWSERFARRLGVDPGALYNLAWVGLLAGLAGARLGFAVQNLPAFLANPLGLFSLTPTMFHWETGLLVGGLAAAIYGQRKGLPAWNTLDALAPGISLFIAALHLANAASGNAFGTPTALPWGIELWGETRHPVQLYEFLISLVIWFGISRLANRPARPGTIFWAFIALTALARLFFEFFRADAQTLPGGIHTAQVIAWLLLAAALWRLKETGWPAALPSEGKEH